MIIKMIMIMMINILYINISYSIIHYTYTLQEEGGNQGLSELMGVEGRGWKARVPGDQLWKYKRKSWDEDEIE